jgi:hypothetical protein
VSAADLVAIVTKKENAKAVRVEAGRALEEAPAKNNDRDLAPRQRSGGMSERARFAKDQLLPWLTRSDKKDGDRWTREIVAGILNRWFLASGRNATVIALYDADNERTWAPAAAAWREVFRDG